MTESLEQRLRSPGFTPRARDAGALFDLLATAPDDSAKDVERALGRLGAPARQEAMLRFPGAAPPLRSRLCALVGRFASESADPPLVEWLLERLEDSDPRTRRRATRSLGKLADPRVEPALVAAWKPDVSGPDARALALSLGNVGTEAALEHLRSVTTTDLELSRLLGEAIAKIERKVVRLEPGAIDGTRLAPTGTRILLHVRTGLEEILGEELGDEAAARLSGRGRIEMVLAGPLAGIFSSRTFLHAGFPLAPERAREADVVEAAARAIASDAAMGIFSAFTRGPIRYRIDWSTGRRRGATWRVATRVAQVRPELVNDPTAALWEAVITDRSDQKDGRVFVELWPRGLVDPRFSYRRRTLPASSHPTIAAAIAHVGGVRPDDVIWDPFVGAGGELVERALLGPYARLIGSDLDAEALDAARENFRAASVDRWELLRGDSRSLVPREAPSLVLSNPPFGKRVRSTEAVDSLLEATLHHVTRTVRPAARLVWMSPAPEATASMASRLGWTTRLRRTVDVGGFRAELQSFVRDGA